MKYFDHNGVELVVRETTVEGRAGWGVFKVIRTDPKSDGLHVKLLSSIPLQPDRTRAMYMVRSYVTRRGGRVEGGSKCEST
jgi:hypothetical protein